MKQGNITNNIYIKKKIPVQPKFSNYNNINYQQFMDKRMQIRSELVIYVYVVCYNEEFMLPFFLKHYEYATKIFIYDNCSNDNTIDIINKSNKCEVIMYSSDFNDCWNHFGALGLPRPSQTALRCLKTLPTGTQERPRGPQDPTKRPQDRP